MSRTARLLRERLDSEPAAVKPWEESPIPELTFRDVPRCPDPCVEFRSASKSYGARPVLRGLSFQCRRGQRLALCGPNGSGKTTILRLLLGQETSDSGHIVVAPQVRFGYYAQEIDTLDPPARRADQPSGTRSPARPGGHPPRLSRSHAPGVARPPFPRTLRHPGDRPPG